MIEAVHDSSQELNGSESGDSVSRLVALILLGAGLLKWYQLSFVVADVSFLFGSRGLSILLVCIEVSLGLSLLLGIVPILIRSVTIPLFAIFAVVSAWSVRNGQIDCGCFGAIRVSPWITLVVDISIIGLLLAFKPRRVRRSAIQLVSSLVFISAICAIFLSTMLSVQMATIDEHGLLSDGGIVWIQGNDWIDQPFPLLPYVQINADLRRGKWVVVLYEADCNNCDALIDELRYDQSYRATETRIALVEVPPLTTQHEARNGPFIWGSLTSERQWIVETPAQFRLHNGRVVSEFPAPVP